MLLFVCFPFLFALLIIKLQLFLSFAEVATKKRIDLIKAVSLAVIQDLKIKGDNAFKDMNDWLGARFLKEMERYHILLFF